MATMTKVIMCGGMKAVRIPREFKLEADTVRLERTPVGLLIYDASKIAKPAGGRQRRRLIDPVGRVSSKASRSPQTSTPRWQKPYWPTSVRRSTSPARPAWRNVPAYHRARKLVAGAERVFVSSLGKLATALPAT
jgi:hypothetical protein